MVHKILGNIPEHQVVFGQEARTLSAYLTSYDTLFLVGDCGDADRQEWNSIKNITLQLISNTMNFDTNGPSLQFINSSKAVINSTSSDEFSTTLANVRPSGLSDVGSKLQLILNKYADDAERAQAYGGAPAEDLKPLSIVVVSDGDFDETVTQIIDDIHPALKRAKALKARPGIDRWVGIQFLQIGDDEVATTTDTKIANALPVDENVIDTVNYKSGALSTDLLYRTLLGAINAQVAQYVHQSDPQDDDPEKPWTGPPLLSNQAYLWIPSGKTASITAQANAGIDQNLVVSTYPGTHGVATFTGYGEGAQLYCETGSSFSINGGVFVYFDFNYEGSSGWAPSRVKLVAKAPKTEYTFGSDDGNYGHPDGDYNDTLVTTIIT